MPCCYLCANWRQLGRPDEYATAKSPGMCTLWPNHIESLAGNYCGQFVSDRGYNRYGDTPRPLEWLEWVEDWREACLKERKEVKRLKGVNKELRRKLREQRAK